MLVRGIIESEYHLLPYFNSNMNMDLDIFDYEYEADASDSIRILTQVNSQYILLNLTS